MTPEPLNDPHLIRIMGFDANGSVTRIRTPKNGGAMRFEPFASASASLGSSNRFFLTPVGEDADHEADAHAGQPERSPAPQRLHIGAGQTGPVGLVLTPAALSSHGSTREGRSRQARPSELHLVATHRESLNPDLNDVQFRAASLQRFCRAARVESVESAKRLLAKDWQHRGGRDGGTPRWVPHHPLANRPPSTTPDPRVHTHMTTMFINERKTMTTDRRGQK